MNARRTALNPYWNIYRSLTAAALFEKAEPNVQEVLLSLSTQNPQTDLQGVFLAREALGEEVRARDVSIFRFL